MDLAVILLRLVLSIFILALGGDVGLQRVVYASQCPECGTCEQFTNVCDEPGCDTPTTDIKTDSHSNLEWLSLAPAALLLALGAMLSFCISTGRAFPAGMLGVAIAALVIVSIACGW